MRIIVAGDGIAGTSVTALVLRKLRAAVTSQGINDFTGANFEVILCSNNHFHLVTPTEACKLYTGLWNPSMEVLQHRMGIPSEALKSSIISIRDSGYRSSQGEWLARPYSGLKSYPGTPSLSFTRNSLLKTMINDALQEEINCNAADGGKISFRAIPCGKAKISPALIKRNVGSLELIDDKKNPLPIDILIIADGMFSSMRSKILYPNAPSPPNSSSSLHVDGNLLEHRGYRVYRGSLTHDQAAKIGITTSIDKSLHGLQSSLTAYQMWAPKGRFAVVPTIDGLAWFAAISVGNTHDYFNGIKVDKQTREDSLSNFASKGDTNDFNHLMHYFHAHKDDWEQEVLAILSATNRNDIVFNDAWAFKVPIPSLLSGFYYNQYHNLSTSSRSNNDTLVLFAGDAAHSLDPILAQGAGVAIEDAEHISSAIVKSLMNKKYNTPVDTDQLLQKRLPRIRRLHHVSNLAQYIGEHPNPLFHVLRNSVLLSTPNVVKGKIFDQFIQTVSTAQL